ncbi:MAG: hypothetical protein K6F14_07795 [Clostridiales bacterium]|nr:hypothetical protein [Clostridiales bacterium]
MESTLAKIGDVLRKYGFFALIAYVLSTAVIYLGQAFNTGFVGAIGWILSLALVAAFYGLIVWAKMTKKDQIASTLCFVAIMFIVVTAFFDSFMNLPAMEGRAWFIVIYYILDMIATIGFGALLVLYMAKKLFNKALVSSTIAKFILFGLLALTFVVDLYAFIVDIVVGAFWFITLGEFAGTFLLVGLMGDALTLADDLSGGKSSAEASETKEEPKEESKTEETK